jgi:tetratricopeptide (TPR) repeat protein
MRPFVRIFVFGFLIVVSACKGGKNEAQVPLRTDLPPEVAKVTAQIVADSLNPELYYQRAQLWLDKKDGKSALEDADNAIRLKPGNSKYYVTQADAYLILGQAKLCRESLQKAIDMNSEETEAYLKMAELNLYFRDYNQVFSYVQKALDVDPNIAKAHFIRGFAMKERGDTAGAIKNYLKATDLKQDYYDAYIQLGMLYSVRKNKIALDYLNNALKIRPNSVEALYFQGMFYQETEDLNKAMELYNKIITLDPKYKFAYFNLGYIHMYYLRVYDKAAQYYTSAIQVDPAYVEAYYNRGYSAELAGDVQKARLDYNKAIELRQGYSLALSGLKRLDALDKNTRKH